MRFQVHDDISISIPGSTWAGAIPTSGLPRWLTPR